MMIIALWLRFTSLFNVPSSIGNIMLLRFNGCRLLNEMPIYTQQDTVFALMIKEKDTFNRNFISFLAWKISSAGLYG